MSSHGWSGLVLAGGRSMRMGRDKALLQVADETLLERQARVLREAGASEVLISTRPGAPHEIAGCRLVFDEKPDLGPLGGILAGLRAAGGNRLLVLAVDLPAMTAEFLLRLASFGSGGVVPRLGRKSEPLAALYVPEGAAMIERSIATGELRAQRLADKLVVAGLAVAYPVTPEEARYFENWNEPDDPCTAIPVD